VENLDDMLKNVPGIGCILIGEGDLSQELGYPRQYEHKTVLEWMKRVVDTCKKHNVVVGHPHVEQGNAERIIKEGYRFLMCAPVQSFGAPRSGAEAYGTGRKSPRFPARSCGECREGAGRIHARSKRYLPHLDSLRSVSPGKRGRCSGRTPSPPFSSMKCAISSTPLPARRLVKTKGRVPRMRFDSRSIVSSEAPTWGARSTLLMTRRSERVMPGPPFDGILSPAATSIT
jgi:hypothetical protein